MTKFFAVLALCMAAPIGPALAQGAALSPERKACEDKARQIYVHDSSQCATNECRRLASTTLRGTLRTCGLTVHHYRHGMSANSHTTPPR